MPSSYTTTQGEAWDQIALSELGDEVLMSDLLPVNVAEMDALLFSGEVRLTIPDEVTETATVTLPPWEQI